MSDQVRIYRITAQVDLGAGNLITGKHDLQGTTSP